MPLPSWMSWALPIVVVGCGFTAETAAKCRMKNPDTMISGILLTNRESAIKVVGTLYNFFAARSGRRERG